MAGEVRNARIGKYVVIGVFQHGLQRIAETGFQMAVVDIERGSRVAAMRLAISCIKAVRAGAASKIAPSGLSHGPRAKAPDRCRPRR